MEVTNSLLYEEAEHISFPTSQGLVLIPSYVGRNETFWTGEMVRDDGSSVPSFFVPQDIE